MVDVWRYLHPDTQAFTWEMKSDFQIQQRIDLHLIDDSLIGHGKPGILVTSSVINSKIKGSDHKPIETTFRIAKPKIINKAILQTAKEANDRKVEQIKTVKLRITQDEAIAAKPDPESKAEMWTNPNRIGDEMSDEVDSEEMKVKAIEHDQRFSGTTNQEATSLSWKQKTWKKSLSL